MPYHSRPRSQYNNVHKSPYLTLCPWPMRFPTKKDTRKSQCTLGVLVQVLRIGFDPQHKARQPRKTHNLHTLDYSTSFDLPNPI